MRMSDPLKTKLGLDIPVSTRGILYLCAYSGNEITVFKELLFDDAYTALNYYAEIPNPESQLVTADTFDQLISELVILHKNMEDTEWLKQLGECI